MAESKHISSNPLEDAVNTQPVFHGEGRPVPLGDREFASGGEVRCTLRDGLIIDATFPLV